MVRLTEYEKKMLEGAEGPAVADFTDVDLFALIRTGDIVELDGKFYYCDSFGFVELKNW